MSLTRDEVGDILSRGESTKIMKFKDFIGREVKYFTTIADNKLHTFEKRPGETYIFIEDTGLHTPSYWIVLLDKNNIEILRKNVLHIDVIEWETA